MSNTNTNVRSLRDKFQQQHPNRYEHTKNDRLEQKHDIIFRCNYCGKNQTIVLILQSNETTKEINQYGYNEYTFDGRSKNIEKDVKSSVLIRAVPTINEEEQRFINETQKSNHSLDFDDQINEDSSKTSVETNIQGFVDGCVRSSLHEISNVNNNTKEVSLTPTRNIVEVEVEYDPILGNVKSTRKRSSVINTSLDNDYRMINYRQQSENNRYKLLSYDVERDNTPIWARRRKSHSTVKPSELIREYDKKEKLESNALRRLSRADLAGDTITSNSTTKTMINYQNPSLIKEKILRWCQELTQFYRGVNIRNFSSSWSDGLAFCAIVHRFFPDEFNFETLYENEPRQNFELAFTVAHDRAGIEPLIDVDDMVSMGSKPDSKVVFTYVQSLYRHLSQIQPAAIMRERW